MIPSHMKRLFATGGHRRPGLFIVFEGTDGSGKSTQSRRLNELLEEYPGPAHIRCGDPTPVGPAAPIRTLLKSTPLSPETQVLLFTAARIELAKEIRARLAAGETVICDRWFFSTYVYQIMCPGPGARVQVEAMEALALEMHSRLVGLNPDITLLLDVSTPVALERVMSRRRDHLEEPSLVVRRAEAYRSFSDVCAVIPADGPEGEVGSAVLRSLLRCPKWSQRYLRSLELQSARLPVTP